MDLTALLVEVGIYTPGRAQSWRGNGDEGGDKNVTFFWAPDLVPFGIFHGLLSAESVEPSARISCSAAEAGADVDAGSAAAGRLSLVSVAGNDIFAAIGVVAREDSVDDYGSPIEGRLRIENSNSGL